MIRYSADLLPVAQTAPQLYCQLVAIGLDQHELARVRDACHLAVHQTGDLLRGSGKPFSCHVIGVASLVAEATSDVDSVVAALLHALSQPRVSFKVVGDAGEQEKSRRTEVLDSFGERVAAVLNAYQDAAPLAADAPPARPDEPLERAVRILQLADMLEDGLDGGPWWHGRIDDLGDEPGSAVQQCARLRGLETLFAQAPELGAASLLSRFEALMAEWGEGKWPACLRTGRYSSFNPKRAGDS